MVIKGALPHLLRNELKNMGIVQNHTCIRQMIDGIESPPSLVLEYLDDNLLDVCSRKRLGSSEVKVVARTVLEALAVLHEWLRAYWSVIMVHQSANCCSNAILETDVKPDNVLVNYGDGATRFSRVALGDCGDVYRFDPMAERTHVIGAAIFRTPEEQLNLRWGQPTDIWSLGATLRT